MSVNYRAVCAIYLWLRLRADFTNSGQLAGLLNANYLKTTAKSDSRFTKQK